MDNDSDLIAFPFLLGALAALVIIGAAFVFVGAWAGIALLVLAGLAGIFLGLRIVNKPD